MSHPPSYIDKELNRIQDCERRAHMHLRMQLGLNPLSSRSSASASASSTAAVAAPPPIPPRNPARGDHYTCNHKTAESSNLPQNEAVGQEQQAQQHDPKLAEESRKSRNEETEASSADYEKDLDTEKKSNVMMDDLSDAIGLALDEWKNASNHN